MKFTLKDYQRVAVDEVLTRLEEAKVAYRASAQNTSFSLTAATGAGKTVMAAAAIEALFYGSDDFEFDADPGAVVIWFSDDPSLNEQTRFRLMEASDKLEVGDLIRVEPPFARKKLESGKVYFLNTGKLTKNSLLTRGHDAEVDHARLFEDTASPDLQGHTIWETIANTIDDPALTLYLVLDEAHRGFRRPQHVAEKPTLVRRLVNGHVGYPPIPIVWGISATIERFDVAMKAAESHEVPRRALDPVRVNPGEVQESGLVKDIIELDIPKEHTGYDTVMVKRAARKLRASTEAWREYEIAQKLSEPVIPLMILQVPNTPDADDIGRALDIIAEEFDELRTESVRHVLGDHKLMKFGGWSVDWIEPERVQETTRVRVLIAKDAISTGWDCPRAEVLMSFRPAKDHTHITQLLGRMVRNPLARRVPGDERLNSVNCILPNFDRTTAFNVVKYLTGNIDEMPVPPRKVIIDGHELLPNPEVPDAVWDVWDELPTETLPLPGSRPIQRLMSLAFALSHDKIRTGALKDARETMHLELDSLHTRFEKSISTAAKHVENVEVQSIIGTTDEKHIDWQESLETADVRAIRTDYAAAKRAFGGDVADSYVNRLAGDDADDIDILEAYTLVTAMSRVPELRERIDREATTLADTWFDKYRVPIKGLPDDRRQDYETIRAQASEPMETDLQRPRSRVEEFMLENLEKMPVVEHHLMVDTDGYYPLGRFNEWEIKVLESEMARDDAIAWYRNPASIVADSLGVSYRDHLGNWRSMHPDFVFFTRMDNGIVASIVDPHSHHLDDSLPKLVGLAKYAEKFGDSFHRIESVSAYQGKMRVLDMQRHDVRAAVSEAKSALEMFVSDWAHDYQ